MCRQAWEHGSVQPGSACANLTAPTPPSAPATLTCSAACFAATIPNFETGTGFYAYTDACLAGGEGCVVAT
eukprot:4812421-Prymnesium_polylepis.1